MKKNKNITLKFCEKQRFQETLANTTSIPKRLNNKMQWFVINTHFDIFTINSIIEIHLLPS